MGVPKRNRKKYQRPQNIHNSQRILEDNSIIEEYGLKNMKELWKVQSETSRVRGNVRKLLAATSSHDEGNSLVSRLVRLGMVKEGSTLDDLLDMGVNAMLERRLQSVVFRNGLARTMKQARQLVVHGFISVDGKRVNRPGYIVERGADKSIAYYKSIDITPKTPQQEQPQPPSEAETEMAAEAEGSNN